MGKVTSPAGEQQYDADGSAGEQVKGRGGGGEGGGVKLTWPVLASYPVGGEGGAEGGAYVSLRMGRGLGQGGADGGQLQDCGSVACGGRSSRPGLKQELGRRKVVGECIRECPLWPLFASDSDIKALPDPLAVFLLREREVPWMIRGINTKTSPYSWEVNRQIFTSPRYGEVDRQICLSYFRRADLPSPLLSL